MIGFRTLLFFLILQIPFFCLSQETKPLLSARGGYGWHFYERWRDLDPNESEFYLNTAPVWPNWEASISFYPFEGLFIGIGVLNTVLPTPPAFENGIILYNFNVGYQFDVGRWTYLKPQLQTGITKGTLLSVEENEWTGGAGLEIGFKVFPWLAASYSTGVVYFDERDRSRNNPQRVWYTNTIFQHHTFGIRYFLLRNTVSKEG